MIKLFFTESISAVEEQIINDDLEEKRLDMMEKIQISEREVAAMKKTITDKSLEITRANQNRIRLEKEKSLLKLNFTKTEWNLKNSIKKAKKIESEKWSNRIKSFLSTVKTQVQPRSSSCKFVLLLISAKIKQKSIS